LRRVGGGVANTQSQDNYREQWARFGLKRLPRVSWFPRKIFPYAAHLENVFEMVEDGDVDAILFADERRSSPKDNLRDVIGTLQVPIIDLSGRAGDFADVVFDVNKPKRWPTRRVLSSTTRHGAGNCSRPFTIRSNRNINFLHTHLCRAGRSKRNTIR
jgi:hypothetical protein